MKWLLLPLRLCFLNVGVYELLLPLEQLYRFIYKFFRVLVFYVGHLLKVPGRLLKNITVFLPIFRLHRRRRGCLNNKNKSWTTTTSNRPRRERALLLSSRREGGREGGREGKQQKTIQSNQKGTLTSLNLFIHPLSLSLYQRRLSIAIHFVLKTTSH